MKYSVILGSLGNTRDHFLSSGYKETPTQEELFKQAASIGGVEGLELVGTWDNLKEKNELTKPQKLISYFFG